MNGTASETTVKSWESWESVYSNNPRLHYGISDIDYKISIEYVFDTAELSVNEFNEKNKADIEYLCNAVEGCKCEPIHKIVDYRSHKNNNYRGADDLSELLKKTIKSGTSYTLMINRDLINGGYYLRIVKGEINPYTQRLKAIQALYIRLIDGYKVKERLQQASHRINHHSELYLSANDLTN